MSSNLHYGELSLTEPVIDTENLSVNILAILITPASGMELRSIFDNPNTDKIEIHVGDPVQISEAQGPFRDKDILILEMGEGSGIGVGDLPAFIEKYHRERRVIVTTDGSDLSEIHRILDAGAVDVLSRPIRRTDLAVALDHARRREPTPRTTDNQNGKIVAFLKAGGGVGATTLATQGAALLARGRKKYRPKVCLVDFDVQFGQVGLQLDGNDTVGLLDLINASERLDNTLIESVMGHHRSGLDYLIAPKEVLAMEVVTPEFVTTLLAFLRTSYDIIFLDMPQTWTAWSLAALQEANLIVLVGQLSVASVAQAVKQIQTLGEEGIDQRKVLPVLNRYAKKFSLGGDAHLKDAEKALRQQLTHFIPSDYELVNEAINQGSLISAVRRSSKIEKALIKLLNDVHERVEVADKKAASMWV